MTMTGARQLLSGMNLDFSEQQWAAITAPLEPGVVIAGAGSGKTTVMAARVVWLVGSGQVRPEQVLGLTFTRKAAAELSSRIRGALVGSGVLASDDGEEVVLTYDAFAGQLVKRFGVLLGLEDGWRMITGAARFRLAARVVADAPGPWKQLSRLRPASVTQRVLALAQELRSHLIEPSDLVGPAASFRQALDDAPRNPRGQQYAALAQARAVVEERAELAALVADYEALKAELGYVEFADQMAWAARLGEEVSDLAQSLRSEFTVVLLDEYQDTSAAQARLLRSLFSGGSADTGRGHPVTAVGDPCQAIYTWRGAAASNILRFNSDFPRRDGRPAAFYPLTVNRRSGPEILRAANLVAKPLRDDPAITSAGLDLDLVCPPETPAAMVEVAGFESWPEEAGWVAERIASARAGGEVDQWSRIAVLTRRNRHLGDLFAVLSERGIPAEVVGLGGLLETPPVAEVVATLRLVADPTDNPALVRLLTSARWAIGPADLAALGRRARELSGAATWSRQEDLADGIAAILKGLDQAGSVSLLEALQFPGEQVSAAARSRFSRFDLEFSGLRRRATESVVDLVLRVIEVLGLRAELAAAGQDPQLLSSFVEAVAAYVDADGEASLAGLLSYLEAEREYGVGLERQLPSPDDSVKLLTVHRAKGLEWDLVLLPALAADVFPSDRVSHNWLRSAEVVPAPLRGDASSIPQLRRVDNAGFAEYAEALKADQRHSEDRLAYVAVTRARRHLIATTHTWAPLLIKPRRGSSYLEAIAEASGAGLAATEPGQANPLAEQAHPFAWPDLGEPEALRRRILAADLVRAAPRLPVETDLDTGDRVRRWLATSADLLAVPELPPVRPDYLAATAITRIEADPDTFQARQLRPMPRRPSEARRAGDAFHRWIEQRFSPQAPLVDDAEPAGQEVDPAMVAAFLSGPFAERTPIGVEVPFTMVLAGRLVRGRIDAVFSGQGERVEIVDWKTGSLAAADPLQLAIYRVAWSELHDVDPDLIDVCFYEVASGRVHRPSSLPDRARLEAMVTEFVLAGLA